MRCMPYGPIVIFPATLAFLAATLTFGFGFGCSMISFNWGAGAQISYIGPWTAERIEFEDAEIDDAYGATIYYSTTCYLYSSFPMGAAVTNQFDAPAKTAKAFSMMAIVLAIPLMVVAMLPCCMVLPKAKTIYLATAAACIWTMFSSFMTLIMKKSVLCNNCEYGWSAWTCITAGLMWLFTAIGMFILPDTPEPEDEGYPDAADQPAEEGQKEVANENVEAADQPKEEGGEEKEVTENEGQQEVAEPKQGFGSKMMGFFKRSS